MTSPPQLPYRVPCCCKVLDAVLRISPSCQRGISHTKTTTRSGHRDDRGRRWCRRLSPPPLAVERRKGAFATHDFPTRTEPTVSLERQRRGVFWKQVPGSVGFCMPEMGRWQWAEDLAREDDLRTSRPDGASCLARSIMEDGASASPPCGTLLRPSRRSEKPSSEEHRTAQVEETDYTSQFLSSYTSYLSY
jgi:hypothetical protein